MIFSWSIKQKSECRSKSHEHVDMDDGMFSYIEEKMRSVEKDISAEIVRRKAMRIYNQYDPAPKSLEEFQEMFEQIL